MAAVPGLPCVMLLHQDRAGQRQQGLGLGESTATLVLRLVSLLTCFVGFVDRTVRRWRAGNPAKASTSSRASRSIATTLGCEEASILWPRVLVLDLLRVGQGEGGADDGAAISPGPLGTLVGTLRMKCTRQRCRAAPWKAVAMAFFRPVCASEITSFTPPSPRALRERRNAAPNTSNPCVPGRRPGTSRRPSAATGEGDHHRPGHRAAVHPRRGRRGRPGTRTGSPSPRGPGRGTRRPHGPGPRSRETSDFSDAGLGAQRLDVGPDLAGKDPVQVRLQHHMRNAPGPPPGAAQQRGEERAGEQLGDLQVQVCFVKFKSAISALRIRPPRLVSGPFQQLAIS